MTHAVPVVVVLVVAGRQSKILKEEMGMEINDSGLHRWTPATHWDATQHQIYYTTCYTKME